MTMQTKPSRRAPQTRLPALCLAAAVALPGAAHAGLAFPGATLAPGQSARVVLSNLAEASPRAAAAGCTALVRFIGADGQPLGSDEKVQILPGTTATVVADSMLAARGPVLARASISFYEAWPCAEVRGGYEVFAVDGGATQFLHPGVIRGFNPQPDPPKD